MTESQLKMRSDFQARLEALPVLKTFPAVATRVLAACEDENSNARELVEIIQCDPTISIQLLRVANSAAYGFGGQIRSLEHATVVLGFRSVKNLAVSIAAASVFDEATSAVGQREALWQHSLGCAVIARRLAEEAKSVDPEEAFLAGMVHDVGKLVFLDLAAEAYDYNPTTFVSTPTCDDETRNFGIHHGQIGNRCGVEWGLPEEINEAITHHHDPHSAEWAHELVAVVYAANRLAKSWGVGPQADHTHSDLLAMISDVDLGIDAEQLNQVAAAVHREFADLAQAFTP